MLSGVGFTRGADTKGAETGAVSDWAVEAAFAPFPRQARLINAMYDRTGKTEQEILRERRIRLIVLLLRKVNETPKVRAIHEQIQLALQHYCMNSADRL